MGLRINSGTGGSTYQIQKNQSDLQDSLRKLSTGKRINRAADDASGMVIAGRLNTQAAGFAQAMKNASDAVSIVQTADGALGQAADLALNIRVKAIQAAGPAQSAQSRSALQAEITADLKTLQEISEQTSFNGQPLLSGSFTDKTFQVGAESGETINISIGNMGADALGVSPGQMLSDIDVTTDEGAQNAISIADAALEQIDAQRASLGADQNRLNVTIENLADARIQSLSAASQIEDLDYAEEAMNLNRIKLLAKARNFAQAQAGETAGRLLDIFQ